LNAEGTQVPSMLGFHTSSPSTPSFPQSCHLPCRAANLNSN